MNPEFELAITQAEKADGIRSFVTQTKALAKCQHERDEALAALGRVRALCDSSEPKP